jgi:hypothetical protein
MAALIKAGKRAYDEWVLGKMGKYAENFKIRKWYESVTTRRHIPKERRHLHRRENLKSHLTGLFVNTEEQS